MNGRRVLLTGSLLVMAMILGIAGVALADEPVAQADEPVLVVNIFGCSDPILDGLYVFTASGFAIVGGVPQPQAIVELIRFHGDGTADVPGGRVSVNGTVFPTGGTGAYTISSLPSPNRGCEGSLTFPAASVHLYLFIPPDARNLQVIRTDTNTVFQGTATKVSR